MNEVYLNAEIGRKNIVFGIALFLILGVAVGIPLTIDFMGGTLLSGDQYQEWKVVHGYGVFLSFINIFFGLCVDHLILSRRQKELASWAFLLAGLIGGILRSSLVMVSALSDLGVLVSLAETALFVLGTAIVVRGLTLPQPERLTEQPANARRV